MEVGDQEQAASGLFGFGATVSEMVSGPDCQAPVMDCWKESAPDVSKRKSWKLVELYAAKVSEAVFVLVSALDHGIRLKSTAAATRVPTNSADVTYL